jgi:presenilin-like A22 family membrane protease
MNHQNDQKTSWETFLIEAFLFSLTLGLGVGTAAKMEGIFRIQKVEVAKISFWQFIFYFLLATFFIFFLTRFLKFKKGKEIIFKTLFVLAVSLGGLIFLGLWLSEPLPLILIFLLIFWWLKKPAVLNQDILMILGMAGVGSALGLSFQPRMVIGLLIIFSIYDFIAVYKTKHMIKMAREMIENRAILALVIPSSIGDFKESLEKVRPGGRFLILGGGDIVFPLLFSSSLVPVSILDSIIVAIFSLIGLFVSFYLFTKQKVRAPIPALPPIALFSIIGYLITKLL